MVNLTTISVAAFVATVGAAAAADHSVDALDAGTMVQVDAAFDQYGDPGDTRVDAIPASMMVKIKAIYDADLVAPKVDGDTLPVTRMDAIWKVYNDYLQCPSDTSDLGS